MNDGKKTKKQLINELVEIRKRLSELEASESKHKQAEHELRKAYRQFSEIIEFMPDAILAIDKDSKVIAWNRAMTALTGIKAEDMLGKSDYEYAVSFYGERRPILLDLALHPNPEIEKKYAYIQRKGDILFGETFTPTLPCGELYLSVTASAFRDSNGDIIAAIECIRDNTERKRMEEQITALSITDQLTGLFNRRGFFTLAEQQLKIAERSNGILLLLFADLDYLKWINDNLSHSKGDAAIIEVASILKEVFRESDILARIGGDEFAALVSASGVEDIDVIESRLQQQIDIHNTCKERDYMISISIGVVCKYPEESSSIDELLSKADTLMYEQKKHKRDK